MPTAVVKLGGAALRHGSFRLESYVRRGERTVVVHGAGPRISAALARAGIESRFVGGRRVTTPDALPVVREAMRAENEELCHTIGSRAVSILGDELGLEAELVPELGRVGMPFATAPPRLGELLAAGHVPVVAPLARGPLNVNADDAAAALAIGLRADRLVFVSDVDGIQVAGATLSSFSRADVDRYREHLDNGILPKIEAALRAAEPGVEVRIGKTRILGTDRTQQRDAQGDRRDSDDLRRP
jgi:acetylglutamate kinase